MTPTPQLLAACNAVCKAISDLGFTTSWQVRFRATELLIAHLTQSNPKVVVVHGVAYGRSAVLRLGGALLPTTDAELVQFREQAGPAMLMLGREEPHAILVVAKEFIIELASWSDHDDPGVLIQPFVHEIPTPILERFVAEGLPNGIAVVYKVVPQAQLPSLNRTYEQMARQLALSAAPRVRWLLDSQRSQKERTA